MDEYLVESDLLRRKAEGAMQQRKADGNLSNRKKSLVLVSTHGDLAIPETAQRMRRLCGPRSAPVRNDVVAVNNDDPVALPPAEIEGRESRLAAERLRKDCGMHTEGRIDSCIPSIRKP